MTDQKKPFRGTAEEKAAKELEEKQKRAEERKRKEFAGLVQDRTFRRFLYRYLNKCGVWRMSWDPSARIHFNEGMRWIGLELLDEINAVSFDLEGQMKREAAEDEANGE